MFHFYYCFGLFSKPSRRPSSQPSKQPIRWPSSQPSKQPIRRPTGQPSRQPTRYMIPQYIIPLLHPHYTLFYESCSISLVLSLSILPLCSFFSISSITFSLLPSSFSFSFALGCSANHHVNPECVRPVNPQNNPQCNPRDNPCGFRHHNQPPILHDNRHNVPPNLPHSLVFDLRNLPV